MKELLERLIKLAKEWRDFSNEHEGWNCMTYGTLWCYFSDDGRHASVHFYIETLGQIQVAFHASPTVSGFNIKMLPKIEDAITYYEEKLVDQKEEYSKLNDREIEGKKTARISNLKKQLKELEG